MNAAKFPMPVIVEGRLFFDSLEHENYKRTLVGLSPLPRDPADPIKLLPAAIVQEQCGLSRSTLARRIAASKAE